MTMREAAHSLLPLEGGAPKGRRLAPLSGMKRNVRQSFHVSASLARQGIFLVCRFLFPVQACIIKKNLYMLFLCVP